MSDFQPFVHHVRVPYAWTDAQARVFYANYFLALDEARYAFWHQGLGLGEQGTRDIEHGFFMAHMECDYHDASDFYDLLAISVEPADLGRTSLRLVYRVSKPGADGATTKVFSASMVVVWADQASGRPAPWPTYLREALIGHRGEAVLKA